MLRFSEWLIDISQKALATAKKGIYELPDTLPESWRKRYFKKVEGTRYSVSPEIRNNVIFQTFNLMDPIKFRKSWCGREWSRPPP